MADKRTIKEILAIMETRQEFMFNHLHNIDQHLNKLNERTDTNEKSIVRIYGIGAGFVTLGSLAALILWLCGIF